MTNLKAVLHTASATTAGRLIGEIVLLFAGILLMLVGHYIYRDVNA